MNRDVIFLLVGAFFISVLVVLNLLIWLRPELVIKKSVNTPALFHSSLATLIAIALFLSCFLVGVWISVLKLQGKLGVYL